ncbi:MAG: hypothetical protein IT481_08370 [Gammaproteobacteria bacterium]|nr:hypothetical protein [Gammaproteobacteria bacterium]
MSALRTRTQAQRDAINARAAAWPRPLSRVQRDVLALVADRHPVSVRAMPALRALATRGLIFFRARRGPPSITVKGREELRRG